MNQQLFERQNRLLRAMNGEKTDRVPLMMSGEPALLRYARPEATFGQMVRDQDMVDDTILSEVLPQLPKIDYFGGSVGAVPRSLGVAVMGKTLLPGVELQENEMWQPLQMNPIQEEDYDLIVQMGWSRFESLCLFERIGWDPAVLEEDLAQGEKTRAKYREAGYPFLRGSMLPPWFDLLAYGRGIVEFYTDLVLQPDKVHAALDAMAAEYEETQSQTLRRIVEEGEAQGEKTIFSLAPCVHANCDLVSRDTFEEFAWPLLEKQARLVLDAGGYIFFHMDTNWTNFLDYFKGLPKGRCIFDTDGGTDLLKLKETLGGKMALTGAISPTLMAFGNPDEVYQECRRQIELMGDGFILAPSCTLPANTPKENIDAMYAAV